MFLQVFIGNYPFLRPTLKLRLRPWILTIYKLYCGPQALKLYWHSSSAPTINVQDKLSTFRQPASHPNWILLQKTRAAYKVYIRQAILPLETHHLWQNHQEEAAMYYNDNMIIWRTRDMAVYN